MPLCYLGFQKAPPTSVVAGSSVRVAPIICNDLRDDIYTPAGQETITIRVFWLVYRPESGLRTALSSYTKVDTNTSIVWKGASSAFRPVDVIAPSRAMHPGVELRLGLRAERKGDTRPSAWSFDLRTEEKRESDVLFLPCLSHPIQLTDKSSAEQNPNSSGSSLSRAFTWGSEDQLLIINEESGYELDKHLWDASIHLSRWLVVNRDVVHTISTDAPLTAVELGAGTGLVSLMLAAAQQKGDPTTAISATDLDGAVRLLGQNIEVNRQAFRGKATVKAAVLDWEQHGVLDRATLVLVSDCTYNPAYFSALCKSIKELLAKEEPSLCLLAKKHRHIDEDSLWDILVQHKLSCTLLTGGDPQLQNGSTHVQTGWGIYQIQHAK